MVQKDKKNRKKGEGPKEKKESLSPWSTPTRTGKSSHAG